MRGVDRTVRDTVKLGYCDALSSFTEDVKVMSLVTSTSKEDYCLSRFRALTVKRLLWKVRRISQHGVRRQDVGTTGSAKLGIAVCSLIRVTGMCRV